MVKVLNGAIYNEFMQLVENSEKEIKLCAPFIKTNIIDDIFSYKRKNVNITAITNIRLMSFYRKVLDIDALSKIIVSNGIAFNYPLLHAKIYIFDNEKLIITSANLTESGLKRNKEYGIFTDEIDLVRTANNDFNNMRNDETAREIKNEHLTDIKYILDSIPKEIKVELPKYEIDNDEINSYKIIQEALNFDGWKRDVYDIIVRFPKDHFELKSFVDYVPLLNLKYPNNKHVEAKIRQILQQLRDLGLIKFEGNGRYMRLFR